MAKEASAVVSAFWVLKRFTKCCIGMLVCIYTYAEDSIFHVNPAVLGIVTTSTDIGPNMPLHTFAPAFALALARQPPLVWHDEASLVCEYATL